MRNGQIGRYLRAIENIGKTEALSLRLLSLQVKREFKFHYYQSYVIYLLEYLT